MILLFPPQRQVLGVSSDTTAAPLVHPPQQPPHTMLTLDSHLLTVVAMPNTQWSKNWRAASAGDSCHPRALLTSMAPPVIPRDEGPPFSSDSDSPFLPQENL